MAKESSFVYDNSGFFTNDICRVLAGENIKLLLAYFNTKFFSYVFFKYYAGGGLGEKGILYKSEYMKNYAIPKLTQKVEEKNLKLLIKL